MRYTQITILGYPKKETLEPTRLYFDTDDRVAHARAIDMLIHYGGLFNASSAIVKEKPEQDEAEVARALKIIGEFQNNRIH